MIPSQTVGEHSLCVAAVARNLILYLNQFPCLKKLLENPNWIEFVASIHDVGKISYTFQGKILNKCGDHTTLGEVSPKLDEMINYHYTTGEAALYELNSEVAKIVGAHHGRVPKVNQLRSPSASCYGGAEWQGERIHFVEEMERELGVDLSLVHFFNHQFITGLLIFSDWLASGEMADVHPLTIQDCMKEAGEALEKIHYRLAFPKVDKQFEEIFGVSPRRIQQQFYCEIKAGGVYILEAPMGIGKTEAAFFAVYKLLKEHKITGMYFGLPSTVTSNQIEIRALNFFNTIIPGSSVQLIHGLAWLQTDFNSDSDMNLWYSTCRRALLAPFGVGTIDQALMSVIRVHYNSLRTFSLAGKVVILDEVHSYDTYTSTLLDELIKMLQQLGSTVIILSATLTLKQKAEMLGVNCSELGKGIYPALTKKEGDFLEVIPLESMESSSVSVEILPWDNDAIDQAIDAAISGQQVLWIENVVAEAQDAYSIFTSRLAGTNIEIGLLHSCFTPNDRNRIEQKWIAQYGKDGGKQRKNCGRILVGTQVLEQSLDLDADLLFSRLCPMDMLLQRTGRLYRHRCIDPFRPSFAQRRLVVMDAFDSEKKPVGKTQFVYSPYVLVRTKELLNNLTQITIPQDMTCLLENVYKDREETGILQQWKQKIIDDKKQQSSQALYATEESSPTEEDDFVSTRYPGDERGSLLLVSDLSCNADSIVMLTTNNTKLKIMISDIPSNLERKRIAKVIIENCVGVSLSVINGIPTSDKILNCLKKYIYIKPDNTDFAIGIVTNCVVHDNNGNTVGMYRNDYGFRKETK
ncbi:MAG: CRISPR-associated helicase Cas3' [Sphaerochaetaceae bacterium]